MPLFQLIEDERQTVGIWQISESESDLINKVSLSEAENERLLAMPTEKRRLQWLAIRALIRGIRPMTPFEVQYDENGKPFLPDQSQKLSITHSGKLAAIHLSSGMHCGIDVQQISPKVERIASKFVRDDELEFIPDDQKLEYLNLVWTMKEAVFKHFGTNVEFKRQIRILPFIMSNTSVAQAKVETPKGIVQFGLKWLRIDDYFLTYLS